MTKLEMKKELCIIDWFVKLIINHKKIESAFKLREWRKFETYF